MSSSAPDPSGTNRTLWHGRFSVPPSDDLMAFTISLPFDRTLWKEDVECSQAHVRGLGTAGLLTSDEVDQISAALNRVVEELNEETFSFHVGDEDIHTAIERRVTEICGAVGAKLHTGRSRNDQSVTGLRLWCKKRLVELVRAIVDLQSVLLDRAREGGVGDDAAYLPGYTHLQRAQPVLLAHHFLAHGWALGRDVERLWQTRERLDVSPLGAGALAGSSLPLDPDFTARELGFARRFDNSLDAVSDRDFVAEILFDLALLAVHLSRLGEEWVLWTTEEFGFAVLDDGFATGSSMLPQKKNADIAELARGRSGRAIGNLTGLLTVLKGLPLSYNRDLQEDKEPLFDSVRQMLLGLRALTGMIQSAQLNFDVMRRAADSPALAATDLAEFLVRSGVPFREAHARIGQLVRRSLAGEAPLTELVEAESGLGPEAVRLCLPGVSARNRTSPGGAGPRSVSEQLVAFEQLLASWAQRIGSVER